MQTDSIGRSTLPESPNPRLCDAAHTNATSSVGIVFDSDSARVLRGALTEDGSHHAQEQTPLGALCRFLGFPADPAAYPDEGLPDPPAFEVRFVCTNASPSGSVADLEAAIAETAEHPTRARSLAESLGIGAGVGVLGAKPGAAVTTKRDEDFWLTETLHHRILGELLEVGREDENLVEVQDEHETFLLHSPHFEPMVAMLELTGSTSSQVLARFGAWMVMVGVLAARREYAYRPPIAEDLCVGQSMEYTKRRALMDRQDHPERYDVNGRPVRVAQREWGAQ